MISLLLYSLLASAGVFSVTRLAGIFLNKLWINILNTVSAALFVSLSAFFTWAFFTDISQIVGILQNIVAVFSGFGVEVI